MNYRMILSLLGDVLLVIGAFLLLPCIVAVIYGEPELWVLLATAAGSGLPTIYIDGVGGNPLALNGRIKLIHSTDLYHVRFIWL